MSGEERTQSPMTLTQQLNAIEKLETVLVERAHAILPKGAVNIVDFFILGATQRTLSQSTAFRAQLPFGNGPPAHANRCRHAD
ncbi:hypothetical protein [Mesorhizobium sp. CO1-1-8]|uniref:hypothetical protein n=1 Tax=Mesorhizobium sp. CO1-1-8 TaxID=2876631 RepID=UPI001CD085CA|nr:hypothetical protein [Mesorhizobium sp. CO1-1-8]MBZ9772302.1 hypothetical protein [Mesorhizobium sp. CO1-1-8]